MALRLAESVDLRFGWRISRPIATLLWNLARGVGVGPVFRRVAQVRGIAEGGRRSTPLRVARREADPWVACALLAHPSPTMLSSASHSADSHLALFAGAQCGQVSCTH
jgi:hypothetical protein